MHNRILLLLIPLTLAAGTIARCQQQPFFPKPGRDNDKVFNRRAPQSVLDRIKSGLPANVHAPQISNSNTLVRPGMPLQFAQDRGLSSLSTATTSEAVAENNFSGQGNGFHLTRDINRQTWGSYPNADNTYNIAPSYPVLNNIMYFAADDGISGMELWRSDGTAAGTRMVKDINTGPGSSSVTSMIVANGKLYFSANTDADGWKPWVSDGTDAGTHEISVDPSFAQFYSDGIISAGGKIFVLTSSDFGGDIFVVDPNNQTTTNLYNFQVTDTYSGYPTEAVAAGNLLFFSAWTPEFGRELWRSDGTAAGTFMVKDVGPDQSDFYSPLSLTEYNHKLYYSGDDGTGRTVWVSDGTANGTHPVNNPGHVATQIDNTDYTRNMPFVVLNNQLFFSGNTVNDGSGLYKYNAANPGAGITLVKDLVPGTDIDFISPPELRALNNKLIFKVINSIGGYHDELWISDGTGAGTKPIKVFPQQYITVNYFAIGNTLYFNENDSLYGNEPWKSDGTAAGTGRIKDLWGGNGSSYSFFFTAYHGKIYFNAGDPVAGTELWVTDGTAAGTSLVKDISNTHTENSDAGLFIKGIGTLNNNVLFGAYDAKTGGELFKSDGSSAGTALLNDIQPGPNWSYPNSFITKNGYSYFIADNTTTTTVYRTDGTSKGLRQLIYYIDRTNYYVENFNVLDNNVALYILVNRNSAVYELWRSDGTANGTYPLSTSPAAQQLFLNYGDYIVTAGNKGYFTADDGIHGSQVWVTDGSIAGTKMVKNVNPTGFGSYPYSLFSYHNEIYFGAYDGNPSGYYSLWKSNGTENGTVKVKDVTPAYWDYYQYYFQHYYSQIYGVSKNILYFNGVDYSAANYIGPQLYRTTGSPQSTQVVKEFFNLWPNNLVDANGKLFFLGSDGAGGNELWISDGSANGTKPTQHPSVVFGFSYLDNFAAAGDRLYFIKDDGWAATLWWSDSKGNVSQVTDPLLANLHNIQALTVAGNTLFFNAYTPEIGTELYAGCINTDNSVTHINKVESISQTIENADLKFQATLYPNPARDQSQLRITGAVARTQVSITNMLGQVVWKLEAQGAQLINLPVQQFSTGVYLVSVTSGDNKKLLRLVKQ